MWPVASLCKRVWMCKYNHQIVASFFDVVSFWAGITIIICHHRFSYQVSTLNRTHCFLCESNSINAIVIEIEMSSLWFNCMTSSSSFYWFRDFDQVNYTVNTNMTKWKAFATHDMAIAEKIIPMFDQKQFICPCWRSSNCFIIHFIDWTEEKINKQTNTNVGLASQIHIHRQADRHIHTHREGERETCIQSHIQASNRGNLKWLTHVSSLPI